MRALKDHAERIGQGKRAGAITAEDLMAGCAALISVFIREPEFQGQNKSRLMTVEASRIVEGVVRDAFDHWLAASPAQARSLLDWAIERAEERLRRRAEKDVARKTRHAQTAPARQTGGLHATMRRKARSCSSSRAIRAGGSAKQARDRANQAILPLRGKILNVASATRDKLAANQQLADLMLALGVAAAARIIAPRNCATRRSSS